MAWISENRTPVAVLIAIAIVALFAMRGCGGYSEVNQKTYDLAQSLLQTALRRDDPRTTRTRADSVAVVETKMAAALEAGEISADEVAILTDIINLTKADKWDEAKRELRSLLESQID